MKKPKAENIIFIIYCILLVWIVIFKTSFSIGEFLSFAGQRKINLIPFNFILSATKLQIKETFLNFLVFIPFGLYLRMINVSSKHIILYSVCLSFIFEVLQFIFKIGISDATDLISNTLGACFGVCIYIILTKLFPTKKVHRAVNWITGILLSLFFALFLLLFIINLPTQPAVC